MNDAKCEHEWEYVYISGICLKCGIEKEEVIKQLEQKMKIAVDALKYYADDKIYDPRPSRGYDCAGCEVCGGSGSFRAQEALDKIGEVK